MTLKVTIAGREIYQGATPYIVAEVSGEHQQSWDKMTNLITAVKETGADALKLQLYDPIKLAASRSKGDVNKVLDDGPWRGQTYAQLYEQTYTPRMWFPRIYKICREIGLTCFSSIFDQEDVGFLEKLETPAYKIASPELVHYNLLEAVGKTNKPVIISLGLFVIGEPSDIRETKVLDYMIPAYQAIRHSQVIMLHCVSKYPCNPEDVQLGAMKNYLDSPYPKLVMGFSDHSVTSVAPIVATGMGVALIEKHITLSNENGGWDRSFSLEPRHFKLMVDAVKEAHQLLGDKDAHLRS